MAKYSKADLKALMREKLAAKNRSKIDSPLAAYDSKGQLTCRVCLTHQKELTWTTHLLSQRHKESIEKLKRKSKRDDEVVPTAEGSKRKLERIIDNNRAKPIPPVAAVIKQEEISEPTIEVVIEVADPSQSKSELPVGFFDDPIRDARERNVVYKDPMEEEWTKFQKVMSGESNKAEVLVHDELVETQKEKTVEEIDEQLSSWQRVDRLQKRIEDIRSSKSKSDKKQEKEFMKDTDADGEDDFDALLDWRSKKNRK